MTKHYLVITGLFMGLAGLGCGKKGNPSDPQASAVKQEAKPTEPEEHEDDELTEEDEGDDLGADEGDEHH
jgi:hypothetical protein